MTKIDEQTLKDAVARGLPRSGDYSPPYTSPEIDDESDGSETEELQPPITKDRNKAIEAYRQLYLCKTEVVGRQFIYVSEELHESLIKLVKSIGGKRATLGGYVENIIRTYLSEHKDLLNGVHNKNYKNPIGW